MERRLGSSGSLLGRGSQLSASGQSFASERQPGSLSMLSGHGRNLLTPSPAKLKLQAGFGGVGLTKSASVPDFARRDSETAYHAGRTRLRLQLEVALATQEKSARLRRLEKAIDENRYRWSMGGAVGKARDEARILAQSLAGDSANVDWRPWPPPPLVRSPVARQKSRLLAAVDFSDMPGLGTEESGSFPADECPESLPDLALHRCLAAEVLRTATPEFYAKLATLRTQGGVSLARCIKPGMDAREASCSGLVAGDAECYQLFAPLFEPVIRELHGLHDSSHVQPFDMNLEVLGGTIDPTGSCAKSVMVELRRNVAGLPLAPALSRVQRRVLEQGLTEALEVAVGGAYLPLHGSKSFPSRRGGMGEGEERELRGERMLFEAPEDALELSAGFGRNWPDGRGVWVSEERDVFAWVNEEDHLRLRSLGYHSGDLVGAFRRACRAERALAQALERGKGWVFARYRRLGFVTARPEHLGTALRAQAVLSLPSLDQPELRELCERLKLQSGRASEEGPHCLVIQNAETLGSSEIEQAQTLAYGCRALAEMEKRLAKGGSLKAEMQSLPGLCH